MAEALPGDRDEFWKSGDQKARDLLRRCLRKHGFLATPTERSNYSRVWGRDSTIMGLAALQTGDTELIEGCRKSLETLAKYQGPHGEIPSNVDPETDRVSYGGTTGRVDADLWFIIVCCEYTLHTGDDGFLDEMLKTLEKVRFLLGAWEFNTRGLLYIPPTGDWADEYLQSGYVLFDQLLYYQAHKSLCCMHHILHDTEDHDLNERTIRLKHLIRDNFWFTDRGNEIPDHVYHEIMYKKGRDNLPSDQARFWMPFFSPFGYGYRFDALANSLVSLFGVSDEERDATVDRYIDEEALDRKMWLLPAFHPVVTPESERWEHLQVTFSHEFKNAPYEYHNGGLWPMVSGFHAAALFRRGKTERGGRFLDGIHRANHLEMENEDGEREPWSFPEYVNGKTHAAGGTHPMGWSAAGALLAGAAREGKPLFKAS